MRLENNSCSDQVYQYQVLSDTPFITIIKYIINGEIEKPIVCLDTKSLSCSTLSSGYDSLGAGLPRFNTLTDISTNVSKLGISNNLCKKQSKIQNGEISLNSNYNNGININTQDLYITEPFSIPDNNEIDQINEIKSNQLNLIDNNFKKFKFPRKSSFNKPFNYVENDLVTFNSTYGLKYPIQIGNYFGTTTDDINPIFIGIAENSMSDKSFYLLLEGDNLLEIIKILDQCDFVISLGCNEALRLGNYLKYSFNLFLPNENINDYFSLCENIFLTNGKWRFDGGCNYRYYIEKVYVPNITTKFTLNSFRKKLDLNFLIRSLENIEINGLNYKLITTNNIYYYVMIYKSINYSLKLTFDKQININKELENLFLDSSIGKWIFNCNCNYTYNLFSYNFIINNVNIFIFKQLLITNGFIQYENTSSFIYKDPNYNDKDSEFNLYLNLVKCIYFKVEENKYNIQLIASFNVKDKIIKLFNKKNIIYQLHKEIKKTDLILSILKINNFEYIIEGYNKKILEEIKKKSIEENISSSSINHFTKTGIYINIELIDKDFFYNQLIKYYNFIYSKNGCFYIYKKNSQTNIDINFIPNIAQLKYYNNKILVYGNQVIIEDILNDIKIDEISIIYNNNPNGLYWTTYYQPSGFILIQPQNDEYIISGTKEYLTEIYKVKPELFNKPTYNSFDINILFITIDTFNILLDNGWTLFSYNLGNIYTKNNNVNVKINIINENNIETLLKDNNIEQLETFINQSYIYIYGSKYSIDILKIDLKKLNINAIFKNLIPTNKTISLFQLNGLTFDNKIFKYESNSIKKNIYQIIAEDEIIKSIYKNFDELYFNNSFTKIPFNLSTNIVNLEVQKVFSFLYNITIYCASENIYLCFRPDNTCNNNIYCTNNSFLRLYILKNNSLKSERNSFSINIDNIQNLFKKSSKELSIDLGILFSSLKNEKCVILNKNINKILSYVSSLEEINKYLVPSNILIQLVNLGNKSQLIASNNVLTFIQTIFESINIKIINQGTYQFGTNKFNNSIPILGKLVGLSGGPTKSSLSTQNPNPLVAINSISWNLSKSQNSEYVQFIWETYEKTINNELIDSYIAFQCIANGVYGRNNFEGGAGGITDNDGQPLIGNDAYNPTGNILIKTKGSVNGTIILKVLKTSNWYNNWSGLVLPSNVDNLFSVIQSQDLINRALVQVIKSRNEENILVPYLFNLERLNRYPNRISNGVPSIIINILVGTLKINFTDDYIKNIDKDKLLNIIESFILKQIDNETKDIILYSKFNLIGLPNPNKSSFTISVDITFKPFSKNIIMPNKNNMDKIKKTLDILLELNNNYQYKLHKINIINKISNLDLKLEIKSFLISNNGDTFAGSPPSEIFDRDIRLYSIIKQMEILENLTNHRMDIRSLPTAYDSRNGHHIGGINSNNITKWMDTIVKLTIQGSEFPIQIIPPSRAKPYYSFMDGTKIEGFIINSLGTGYHIPSVPQPPIVFPNNINNSTAPSMFGNMSVRFKTRQKIGGNMYNLN